MAWWVGGGVFCVFVFDFQSALETDKVKCVTDDLPYFYSAIFDLYLALMTLSTGVNCRPLKKASRDHKLI